MNPRVLNIFLCQFSSWDSSGSPVLGALAAGAGCSGLIPGQGTKIPQAMRHSQKIRKKSILIKKKKKSVLNTINILTKET